MKIPTREQCMRMLIEQKTPQNIVEHALVVNKVAVFLAKKLKEAGVGINVGLVDAASLLHDVAKPSRGHADEGAKILEELGYPEVGKIVGKHAFKATFDKDLTWEEKVVQYADKRCEEDRIVSVDKRYDGFYERYGDSENISDKAREITKQREKEIFAKLNITPDQIKELVK